MTTVLELWGITVDELSQALLENGSLRGMVFGYVAEIKLRGLLASHAGVTSATKDDDHDRKKKGDLRIIYKDEEFKIESKSLQTKQNRDQGDGTFLGAAQVDASDRRTVLLPDESSVDTTNLLVGEFDILAINCFTFRNQWDWVFARNEELPRTAFRKYTPEQHEYLLATLVRVTWPPSGIFHADIFELMDSVIEERSAKQAPQQGVEVVEEPLDLRVIKT